MTINLKNWIKKYPLFGSLAILILGILLVYLFVSFRSCSHAKIDVVYWKAKAQDAEKAFKEASKEVDGIKKAARKEKKTYEEKISNLKSDYQISVKIKDKEIKENGLEIASLKENATTLEAKDEVISRLEMNFNLLQQQKDTEVFNLIDQLRLKDEYIADLERNLNTVTQNWDDVKNLNEVHLKEIKVMGKELAWLKFQNRLGKGILFAELVVGGYFLLKK